MSFRKLDQVLCGLVFVFILCFVYGLKNWGYHFDEVHYLDYARFSWMGDAVEFGKPYFVFTLNRLGYLLIESLGLKTFYPYIWFLILSFFYVWSLVFFIQKLELSRVKSWMIGLCLLFQPVGFLVVTSPMMEFPLLAALNFFLGHWLSRSHSFFKIFIFAALTTFIKITSLPIFLALGFCAFLEKRKFTRILVAVLAGAMTGILLDKIPLFLLGAGKQPYYALMRAPDFLRVTEWIGASLYLIGPLFLMALWFSRKNIHRFWRWPELYMVLALVAISHASKVDFVRYLFPLLWALVLLFLLRLKNGGGLLKSVVSLILLIHMGLVFSFFSPTLREKLWPGLVYKELVNAPGTSLYNVSPFELLRLKNGYTPESSKIYLHGPAGPYAYNQMILNLFLPEFRLEFHSGSEQAKVDSAIRAIFSQGFATEAYRCATLEQSPICAPRFHRQECREIQNLWRPSVGQEVIIAHKCL